MTKMRGLILMLSHDIKRVCRFSPHILGTFPQHLDKFIGTYEYEIGLLQAWANDLGFARFKYFLG